METHHGTRSTVTLNDTIKYQHGNDTYDFPLPNFNFGSPSERPSSQHSHSKGTPKSLHSHQEREKKLESTDYKTPDASPVIGVKEVPKAVHSKHTTVLQRSFSSLDPRVGLPCSDSDSPRRFRSVRSFFRRTASRSHGNETSKSHTCADAIPQEPDYSQAQSILPRQSPARFYSRPSTANPSKVKPSIDVAVPDRSLSFAQSKTTSPLKRLEHWLESSLSSHAHGRREAVSSRTKNDDQPSPTVSLDSPNTTRTDHEDTGLFDFQFISEENNGSKMSSTSPTATSEVQISNISDRIWSPNRTLHDVSVREDKPLPILEHQFNPLQMWTMKSITPPSSSPCTSKHSTPNEFSSFYFSEPGSGQDESDVLFSGDNTGYQPPPYPEMRDYDTCSLESTVNAPWSNIEPVTPRSSLDIDRLPDHLRDTAYMDIRVATARQISLEQAKWVVQSADIHMFSKPLDRARKPTIVDLNRPRVKGRTHRTLNCDR